jgi:hypothetical protein
VGLATKGAMIVAYHVFRTPGLARVLTTYDPLGVLFADRVLPLFFDLRGIAPPHGAPTVYEVLLVIGFAVQCFVLGIAVGEVHHMSKGRFGSRRDAPPVVE